MVMATQTQILFNRSKRLTLVYLVRCFQLMVLHLRIRLVGKNFIAWNVKPEFYKVYEYRIPRSRFSGDFVDGNEDRNVFYSDLVRTGGGDDTIKYPGQNC
jgi:hypothetical protein